MKMTKRIGLFLLLFGVPLFFLIPLSKGKTNSESLPYFGPSEEESKNTKIKDFVFYDVDSNTVSSESTEGKTLVVSTLISSCPFYCPIIQKQLKFLVYDKLYDRPEFEDLLFISHLVDTNGGTPNLNQFISEQLDINFDKWKFVTSSTNPIYDLELPGGNLQTTDFKTKRCIGGKTYYKMILLVDRNKNVRGLYQGDQTQLIENMRKDIRKLFIEYKTEDKAKKELAK
jgi:protein SCO1/2